MKKKSTSQSAFFNLRVLIGLFMALAGASLALVGFGAFPAAPGPVSSAARTLQKYNIPTYNPLAKSGDISILPPGFDCSKVRQLGIDKMENFRAGLIMIACGLSKGGKPSPAARFSKFVKSLLPRPLAYGGADVDLITGTETFPSVTQSETYTSANPDNPNEIVVAYNDSSGAVL